MSVLSILLSPLLRLGALIVSVFASIWAVYSKGRQEGSTTERLKSLEETQSAIEHANKARNSSGVESDRGRLYDDDGFKRRD